MQSPTTNLILPTQNISPVASQNLGDGAKLFVRVLAENQDGSFLISAGGNRLTVQSQNPLSMGQTFVSHVSVDSSGKVLLIPLSQGTESVEQPMENFGQNFFYGQSVSPDVTLRVLQFMEQSGLKIDRSLMEKAVMFGKRFKGKEKLASESAAILLQKGINPTEENVLALMSWSLGDFGGNQKENQDNREAETKEGEKIDFLNRLYPEGVSKDGGLLTFMNQVRQGKKHWVFLPYRWDFDKTNASGMIRLLLNLESVETEKVLVDCNLNSTKYFFVLYCCKSMLKEVRFYTLPPLLPSEIKREELRLGGFLSSGMNMGLPVVVTYSGSAFSDGLCSVDEMPTFVETLA